MCSDLAGGKRLNIQKEMSTLKGILIGFKQEWRGVQLEGTFLEVQCTREPLSGVLNSLILYTLFLQEESPSRTVIQGEPQTDTLARLNLKYLIRLERQ